MTPEQKLQLLDLIKEYGLESLLEGAFGANHKIKQMRFSMKAAIELLSKIKTMINAIPEIKA